MSTRNASVSIERIRKKDAQSSQRRSLELSKELFVIPSRGNFFIPSIQRNLLRVNAAAVGRLQAFRNGETYPLLCDGIFAGGGLVVLIGIAVHTSRNT